MAKLPIEDLSRQPLVRGTSCFTTPDGNTGFKNEDLQVSALVRIAAALEAQTSLLQAPTTPAWLAVEQQLPEARPGRTDTWAVLGCEYTGSFVLVWYDHATGKWNGLDYTPRITHWQPLPAGPERGGQVNG